MIPTFAQSRSTTEPAPPLLRVDSTYVWIPALVRDKAGEAANCADVKGIKLFDNGNPENVTEIETHGLPISLVILMQTGATAGGFLGAYINLPALINSMVGNAVHEITLVTFDSRVQEIWHFPTRTDGVAYALTHQHPGNKGAAIKDAIAFGVRQLQGEPGRFRRIILLLSQRNDVGSSTSSQSLLELLGTSSTIVYSLTIRGESTDAVRERKKRRTTSIDRGLDKANQALDEQTADESSALTGGTSYQFEDKEEFDSAMIQMLADFHSGITLGFQPSRHASGFHRIELKIDPPKLRVIARRAYWSPGTE